MSEKRRDKRNRILHNGETQRKDGRYRFKYLDSEGKEKQIEQDMVSSNRIKWRRMTI